MWLYRAKEISNWATMIEIRLHEVIDSKSNEWIYEWFGMDKPFSLDSLQEVLDQHPGEGVKLQIHCDGGNVTEGLAIYDALRTSGREIACNVEGDCHSMAIVLLLAAPKDRRTANPNASFLIHEVSGSVSGNTTSVEHYAELMRDLQNRILDIYADRTGQNREELEQIMKEEKIRDTKFMLEHGFIGAINEYNTNQKKKNMFNWKEALSNLLKSAEKAEKEDNAQGGGAGAQEQPVNEKETLTNRIKDLEAEKGNLQTQVDSLTNERDNAIKERDAKAEQVTNLTAERDGLQVKLRDANNTIAERDKEIINLKSQIGSHYHPGNRLNGQSAGEGKPATQKSSEEQLQECREKMGWTKDKK